MTCGEKITKLRKEKGLTQTELGERLHVTFQAVSKWERGSSTPDFETICLLAKFFDVPLSYFDPSSDANGGERKEKEEDGAQRTEARAELLGVCTRCGIVLREGEAKTASPLVCNACLRKEADQKRRAEERAHRQEQQRLSEVRRVRNRGLILGALIAAVIGVIGFIGLASGDGLSAGMVFAQLFGTAWYFVFFSQLFWDGIVADVAFAGGRLIGTPGVIFEFSLDGFIFLIAMKLLFAFLRLLVYLVTMLATVVAAFLISPFTFLPQLLKLNRGEELG